MHMLRLGAAVAGGPALALAVLAVADAVSLHTEQNAVRCGGGLGWIGPVLGVYALGGVAALAALAALAYALAATLARRSWALGACLAMGTTLGVLIAAGSASRVAHNLVVLALGFGCSWFYPEVAQALAALLVAASAGASCCSGGGRRRDRCACSRSTDPHGRRGGASTSARGTTLSAPSTS